MPDMSSTSTKTSLIGLRTAAWMAGGVLLGGLLFALTLLAQSPLGSSLAGFLSHLFSADSVQTMWYITRAAGFTSYLLIWLSMVWGLAVSSKILDSLLHRSFTYDFHQFLSLLAIGFIGLHMGILLFDRYLPYTLGQILVPFLSTYRPLWVGVGVIGFYLTLLVTVTFYLRGRIGMKAFRAIHVFSLLAYLGVTLHGFLSGTDSSLPTVMGMYAGSFLIVVFLTAYWLMMLSAKRRLKGAPATAGRR
jgi:predicted ferric reductase